MRRCMGKKMPLIVVFVLFLLICLASYFSLRPPPLRSQERLLASKVEFSTDAPSTEDGQFCENEARRLLKELTNITTCVADRDCAPAVMPSKSGCWGKSRLYDTDRVQLVNAIRFSELEPQLSRYAERCESPPSGGCSMSMFGIPQHYVACINGLCSIDAGAGRNLRAWLRVWGFL